MAAGIVYVGLVWYAPTAAGELHDLNYPIAHFLAQHYKGRALLMHDIGVVTYLADVDVVDYDGLAVISDAWLPRDRRPPATWSRVARFSIGSSTRRPSSSSMRWIPATTLECAQRSAPS